MDSPFPGMDPYLEHPALWPDVHNSVVAAIRDVLSPAVAPRYYVALERRAYVLAPDELIFVGRPDVSVVHGVPAMTSAPATSARAEASAAGATAGVLTVDVPMADEVEESYLEVREVRTGVLVTVIELLSPANKLHAEGRRQYEAKRLRMLATPTSLVEVDLLRAGEPMPVTGPPVRADYRILVSRGAQRPRALLHAFGVRDAVPRVPVPLLPGDPEPALDLGAVVHDVYRRARLDLRLDYDQPPVPPLRDDDAAWARGRVEASRS